MRPILIPLPGRDKILLALGAFIGLRFTLVTRDDPFYRGGPMRLAAVLLLFKEESFVEACVRAIYPVVDSICVASQHDRNLVGAPVPPDRSLDALLATPDPGNKLRLVVERDTTHLSGINGEARLRNAAIALDPQADYYLIVDADEIWPLDVLQKCWAEVQRTQWAGYRVSSWTYFRRWNYRVVEPGHGYRPFVFLRRGFHFLDNRQIQWHCPARWREYFRTGRKPKTVFFPPDLRLHHGSCVGDDERILTKIRNYSHADGVAPDWYDRVWKKFHPGLQNFHYFVNGGHHFKSLVTIPTPQLPPEIRNASWPEGWIEK